MRGWSLKGMRMWETPDSPFFGGRWQLKRRVSIMKVSKTDPSTWESAEKFPIVTLHISRIPPNNHPVSEIHPCIMWLQKIIVAPGNGKIQLKLNEWPNTKFSDCWVTRKLWSTSKYRVRILCHHCDKYSTEISYSVRCGLWHCSSRTKSVGPHGHHCSCIGKFDPSCHTTW